MLETHKGNETITGAVGMFEGIVNFLKAFGAAGNILRRLLNPNSLFGLATDAETKESLVDPDESMIDKLIKISDGDKKLELELLREFDEDKKFNLLAKVNAAKKEYVFKSLNPSVSEYLDIFKDEKRAKQTLDKLEEEFGEGEEDEEGEEGEEDEEGEEGQVGGAGPLPSSSTTTFTTTIE